MGIIYQPKGKAREYSPLAANFYNGCNHGCLYCYAPAIRFITREMYKNTIPRKNIRREITRDCESYKNCKSQVLFCFMGDPYCKIEEQELITRFALGEFLKAKIPVAVLTKAGQKCLRDMDIIKLYGEHIKIGMTLTFCNNKDSEEYEPEASLPGERLQTLKILKEHGIKTWASFEPVIKPEQSIQLIKESLPYCNEYKIGKINNFRGLDCKINWTEFLDEAVKILRKNDKPFYIKYDLRQAAPSIKLYGNEVLMDEFLVKPWD